jgi:hypothetical protein
VRRGGRGLLGTMGRTAVIAGTAQMAMGATARRQQRRWAAAEADQATQEGDGAGSAPAHDYIAELQQLAELNRSGVLTDAEFETAKRRILDR